MLSNYYPTSSAECKPDFEIQVKRANTDIEKITTVLIAMMNCPQIEVDHRAVDQVVGALYKAKLQAEKRRDHAMTELEK